MHERLAITTLSNDYEVEESTQRFVEENLLFRNNTGYNDEPGHFIGPLPCAQE